MALVALNAATKKPLLPIATNEDLHRTFEALPDLGLNLTTLTPGHA